MGRFLDEAAGVAAGFCPTAAKFLRRAAAARE